MENRVNRLPLTILSRVAKADEPCEGWLRAVTLNLCRKRLKAAGGFRNMSLLPWDGSEALAAQEGMTPEDKELLARVQEGLKTLPSQQQQCVVLTNAVGLNYGEAGTLLGLSAETVRRYCFVAREKLRAAGASKKA